MSEKTKSNLQFWVQIGLLFIAIVCGYYAFSGRLDQYGKDIVTMIKTDEVQNQNISTTQGDLREIKIRQEYMIESIKEIGKKIDNLW